MLSLLLQVSIQAESKSDLLRLKNSTGFWKPIQITLIETSGSVSPENRSSLLIQIESTKYGLFAYRKETRADEVTFHKKKRLTEKRFEEILSKLYELGFKSFPYESLPKTQMLGVSYNSVELILDAEKHHFFYLHQDLGKKNMKSKKAIIEYIRGIKI
ncbi:hypothetical protein LPTSP4_34980 [Leptospira ryugenii]|uniref:Uncharacterized protein n=2 Tax=Leptospira ryugenii TaxID=1917863 RepID=A0A2P2E509_9LEPT|nr:hypothetical protein LPTSP4_34980 [Leptospira ryugenii]